MVLESILNPRNASDKPWHVFVIAFLYTLVAIVVAHQLFPSQSSILSIALITILFVPFFQKLFELEERKEDAAAQKRLNKNLLTRHSASIMIFSAFFLGVVVAGTFAFMFLPVDNAFSLQTSTLKAISGNILEPTTFSNIFLNNTQVMMLMFILSAIFGAGAVFILAWNASVISVFVGLFTESLTTQGLGTTAAFIVGVPVGLSTLALHGVPEIVAYFVAGLAGGILSVGLIRENYRSAEFKLILKDALVFMAFAELLIIVAAFLEVIV